jgi:hypothetical protein
MVFHVEEEKTRSKRRGKIKYIPKPKVEKDKKCHPDECHRHGSSENLNTKSDHKSGQEKQRSSKNHSKAKKRGSRADFSSFNYPSNPIEEPGSRNDSPNRPNSSKHSKALQENVTKQITLCGHHDSSYTTFDITEVSSDLSDDEVSMTIDDIIITVGSKSELKNHPSHSGPSMDPNDLSMTIDDIANTVGSKSELKNPSSHSGPFMYPNDLSMTIDDIANTIGSKSELKNHSSRSGPFMDQSDLSKTIDDIANTVGSKGELKNHLRYSSPFMYPKPLKGDRLYAFTKSNIMKSKSAHCHSLMQEAVRYPCNSMSFDFAKDYSKLSDSKDSMSIDIVGNNSLTVDLKNHSSYSGPFRYPQPLKGDRKEPSTTPKPHRKTKTFGVT